MDGEITEDRKETGGGNGIGHRWSEWKLFHCISLDLLTYVRNPYNSQTDMHLIPSVGLWLNDPINGIDSRTWK